jgi:hypothetical protein
MKQSRAMSLLEAVTNVVIGYGVAVVTQILIFPLFGLHTTLVQNLMMGAIFTIVSIARSYVLRRLFEAIRVREAKLPNDGIKVTHLHPMKYTRFQKKELSGCRADESTGTGSMMRGRKTN